MEYGGLEADILHAHRPGIGARIMRALKSAIRMHHDRPGMAHRVGVRLSDHINVMSGVDQPINEMAVEPRLKS